MNVEFYKGLGERIRFARAIKRLTLEQLAEMAETSDTTVGAVERAEQGTSIEVVAGIAKALDKSIDWLAYGDVQSEFYRSEQLNMLTKDMTHQEFEGVLQVISVMKDVMKGTAAT